MRRSLTKNEHAYIHMLADDGCLVDLIRTIGYIVESDIGDIDTAVILRRLLMEVAFEISKSDYGTDK